MIRGFCFRCEKKIAADSKIFQHLFYVTCRLCCSCSVRSIVIKLGVDHLIFDGGVVQIPKKISSTYFWLKKNFVQNS